MFVVQMVDIDHTGRDIEFGTVDSAADSVADDSVSFDGAAPFLG